MIARRSAVWPVVSLLLVVACVEESAGPDARLGPSFAAGGVGRPSVLVNPNVNGNGTARTIQEGIDMVAEGGTVMVLPGTYAEALVIDKGLTLEGVGGESGPVIIEQVLPASAPGGGDAVIQVAAAAAVLLRNFTVHHVGLRGINAFGATNLRVEGLTFRGEFPFPAPFFNNGLSSVNNASQSGARSRLLVRGNDFQVFGIAMAVGGDVDAILQRNHVEHTASNSGCVNVSPTGQGVTVPAGAETNVEIRDNVFIDCGAVVTGKQNFALAILGTAGAATGGTINIVGNTVRNTTRTAPSCNAAAIQYEHYMGRIENNVISNAVPSCAPPAARALQGAIFVGSRIAGIRAANVVVRFNDIQGNAFAGLRIGANQPAAINASCNWWGASSGPSGVGPGSGDAVLVEVGAAMPTVAPFAPAPIAGTGATGC